MGSVLSNLVLRMRKLVPDQRPRPASPPAEVPDFFKKHDQDGDGKVTMEELERTHGSGSWWSFLGMDADGDAAVSVQEYEAAQARELKQKNADAKWGTPGGWSQRP